MFMPMLFGSVLLAAGDGGGLNLPEDILRQFTGRIEAVENLGRTGLPPGAIRTHPDARWLVTIKLVKLNHATPGVEMPPQLQVAVHSPVKTFLMEGKAAVGKVFLFVERSLKSESGEVLGSRLEVHPARPFDTVQGWRRLRWGMSDAEVRAALDHMKLKFTEDEMHGMFRDPGPPPVPGKPQDKKTPNFVCATFTRLRFDLAGGRGEAELLGWSLRQVSIINAPFKDEAQVEQHLQKLLRQFGEPDETRAPSPDPGAERLVWFNDESRLTVTTALYEDKWSVHESYQRLPVTWP
jgi:hypothetical protein